MRVRWQACSYARAQAIANTKSAALRLPQPCQCSCTGTRFMTRNTTPTRTQAQKQVPEHLHSRNITSKSVYVLTTIGFDDVSCENRGPYNLEVAPSVNKCEVLGRRLTVRVALTSWAYLERNHRSLDREAMAKFKETLRWSRRRLVASI